MAIQIERNLRSSGISAFAMDALSLMKLVSHETFVEDAQERREQVFSQQNENVIEEQEPEQELEQDDEVSTLLLPLMKSSKNLFLLYNKVKMRLVIFHFKILMILCYLIQKKKRKWKPRMK
jgi:hypothetical protein